MQFIVFLEWLKVSIVECAKPSLLLKGKTPGIVSVSNGRERSKISSKVLFNSDVTKLQDEKGKYL